MFQLVLRIHFGDLTEMKQDKSFKRFKWMLEKFN